MNDDDRIDANRDHREKAEVPFEGLRLFEHVRLFRHGYTNFRQLIGFKRLRSRLAASDSNDSVSISISTPSLRFTGVRKPVWRRSMKVEGIRLHLHPRKPFAFPRYSRINGLSSLILANWPLGPRITVQVHLFSPTYNRSSRNNCTDPLISANKRPAIPITAQIQLFSRKTGVSVSASQITALRTLFRSIRTIWAK